MTPDSRAILRAWGGARWARLTLASRGDIERLQARLWLDRMAPVVRRTPAVAHLAGRKLAAFPVVGPDEIRADFARWNTLGLDLATAEAGARDAEAGGPGEVAPGVAAGFSTGTAGARGLFLSSEAERARYIGLSLARLLPATALLGRWKAALVLRADNRLYHAVEGAGRFTFRFFPLAGDAAARAEALQAYDPDVLIAPAQVLADLARRAEARPGLPPRLRRLFWGAEPMGAGERVWIAEALGVRPDPIYQATEGFLGAPCAEGTLHLNEDALVVELEAVEGAPLFRPVVTDLYRSSQPMIRVRLDDLIEPLPGRCRCGSALRAIAPVEGRVSDLWRWPGRVVRPAEVWAALEGALGPRAEWRAEASATGVNLSLEPGAAAAKAVAAVAPLAGGRPVRVAEESPLDGGPKRRRVRWRS
ncbi:MAG: cell division protein FtsA [Caulobacteraceae bacterium]|nr:cell division protein FtsA [Caulobacteraceae bacterium]